MALYAPVGNNSSFTPHPAGTFPARIVDIYDEGFITSSYAGEPETTKHCVRPYFYCGKTITKDDGTVVPLLVSRRVTLSMHEKATLRQLVQSILGKKLTDAEAAKFDIESLIDKQALIQVSHTEKNGQTYANIDGVLAPPEGMTAPPIPEGFVRRHIRDIEREATERQQGKPQTKLDETLTNAARKNRAPSGPPVDDRPDPVDTRGDDDLPF